ncbi:MAG: HIT domain-containing protein [Candidatus Peribacteraceae bacterium]|nr:HIT domain-containing protein [Candidatus Peribacteraceae bacterium]
MEPRTIFHKILDKELPSTVLYEDDEVLAIKDIHPQAPTHLLFIPKQFVESVAHLTPATAHIPGMLIEKAKNFAVEKGIADYKLMFHVGKYTLVPYLHLHFLSDQQL